ncbi:MAG: hydrogenase nickel incorporation protein HypB, partial [Planktothrix sp.]
KTADVVIINKIDIAEVVGFDRELALNNIKKIVPQARIFEVSAKTGVGMKEWYQFLEQQIKETSPRLIV